MYTSIVLAALLGPGAGATQAEPAQTPTWQKDYVAARKMGREENKPLAVFVGSGAEGWAKVSQDGKLTANVQKLLADSYVCVYLDASTPAGKRLADQFSLSQGLVVSSRDGQDQAFRHSGRMSGQDLDAALRRYSNGYVSLVTETLEEADAPKGKTGAPAGAPATLGSPATMYYPGYVSAGGCGSCGVSYASCGVSYASCGASSCGKGGCGGGHRAKGGHRGGRCR
jgi:hypothetical protein